MSDGGAARSLLRPVSRRALLGASALGAALAGCGLRSAGRGGRPVTLMLDWYPNSDHAGIYAALDRGDFAAQGLDVTIQTPSATTDQIPLVAAGKADFAVSYEPDLLIARGQAVPVQAVFAVVQVPLNSVIALTSSGITHPAQLQGRKVGTSGTPGDAVFLDAVVRADGGDPTKAQSINVGLDLVQSLIGHQVDAIVGGYWNWEAVEIGQEGDPVTVMRLESWGVPTYDELVIIAHAQAAADLVTAFCAALAAGTTYAVGHAPQSLTQLLRANSSLSKPLVQASLQLLQPAWQGSAPQVGYMDPKAWQAFAAWMVSEQWLPQAVDATQAMTDAHLPQAAAAG